jgi:hypothetical protein
MSIRWRLPSIDDNIGGIAVDLLQQQFIVSEPVAGSKMHI